MFLPIETTEAEYRAMAEEDDGFDPSDPSDLDSQDDDYDYNTGRTFW